MRICIQDSDDKHLHVELEGSFDDMTSAIANVLMDLIDEASKKTDVRGLARMVILDRVTHAMARSLMNDPTPPATPDQAARSVDTFLGTVRNAAEDELGISNDDDDDDSSED